jgi:type VI secretion system protein ImpB
MADSGQHWLDRNRPPRVQITYDVETGGAIEKKEIPFVVGVMSDLSAKSEVARPKLKERKFVDIDRDSFGTVLEKVKPRVSFTVKNELQPGGKDLLIAFDIKSMDDFRPEQIVKNVPVLNKLFEARTKLNDLLAKLEGNDDLNAKLLDLAASKASLSAVQAAAAPATPGAPAAPAADGASPSPSPSPSTPPAPTTP